MTEIELSTKYFGKIIVDVDDNNDEGVIYTDLNNQEIRIILYGYSSYRDKDNMCLEVIDKYVEINEIGKKAIMEYFTKSETVRYYFKFHFDKWRKKTLMDIFGVNNFKKMDIENIVEKLEYPNLHYNMENGEISLYYMISKQYSDEILCVNMDKNFNITGFLHES